jgi:subtilisin family serine protease
MIKKYLRIKALVFTSFFILAAQAQAEVKVIKGEYVIVGPNDGYSTKNEGSKFELLKKKTNSDLSALTNQIEVVPVDPTDDTCESLLSSGQASFCEPNYYVEALAVSNDPDVASLYGLDLIKAKSAWDRSVGSSSTVVAVIDTGIDYSHPDLAQNVWVNPGEVAGNGIDDDGNGYIDDIHGINSLTGSGNPFDDNGHGTHCAGTIGARGNNGLGVVGVNWDVKIVGLKFLNSGGGGSIFGAIKAIDYMIDIKSRYGLNLKVSNNSWGGPGYSKALEDAIGRALAADIVFVAAAGNEANNNDYLPAYPANYDLPNVISVAAVDRYKELTFFSNFGQSVDLAAPGMSILSTLPGNRYGSLSGTSMATPHVAGAIALLSSSNPALSYSQLIAVTKQAAAYEPGLVGKLSTPAILDVASMLGISVPAPDLSAAIKRISIRNSKGSKELRVGDKLKVGVLADRDLSATSIKVEVNGIECSEQKTVSLEEGSNNFRAKLSRISSAVKKISFKVGERKASRKILTERSASKVRRSKLSSRSFGNACSNLINSLR